MRDRLIPLEPLSQVCFVHDYVQLVFQDEGFSIYNRANIQVGAVQVAQGETGFCDALVALIGQRVVATPDGHLLTLAFESGAELNVLGGDDDVNGPESFQFNGPDGFVVVEQNV
jgi:hypothetical protein